MVAPLKDHKGGSPIGERVLLGAAAVVGGGIPHAFVIETSAVGGRMEAQQERGRGFLDLGWTERPTLSALIVVSVRHGEGKRQTDEGE